MINKELLSQVIAALEARAEGLTAAGHTELRKLGLDLTDDGLDCLVEDIIRTYAIESRRIKKTIPSERELRLHVALCTYNFLLGYRVAKKELERESHP